MTSRTKLRKLEPVKFPHRNGSITGAYKMSGSSGQPTKKVLAEIKRLSKKDIYPASPRP